MSHDITQADILAWVAAYDGPLFHALLCDPPYHLTTITDRFGKPGSAPAQFGTDGAFARASRGFMNATWDGGDIAFRPETWAALGKLLHPGAFGMAFAGTRGYHRMATAIEDAGFILHPVIAWSFGSGFPKATRIKNETCTCEESETVPKYYMSDMRQAGIQEAEFNGEAENNNLQQVMQQQSKSAHTTGKSPRQGQSRRKERIVEGRSNISTATRQLRVSSVCAMPGTFIVNGTARRLRNGASANNSNSLQTITGADRGRASRRSQSTQQFAEQPGVMAGQPKPQDVGTRQYCDRCGLPIVDEWQGHRYGGQVLKPAIELICVFQKPYAGRPVDSITRTGAGAINIDLARIATEDDNSRRKVAVEGSAPFGAGLFMGGDGHELGRWPSNLVLSHAPTCNGTCAPGCPVAALGAQSGESEAKRSQRGAVNIFDELYKRSPSWHGESTERGHDDSGTAARFFFNSDYALDRLEANDPLIYVPKSSTAEREAGLADFDPTTVGDGRRTPIDNAYQRGETNRRNIHPTVKPISLSVHLAKLLLPPDLYAPRRLLVPFCGVASEIIGAMFAGWEHIEGVELEAAHVEIARARIKWWQTMMRQTHSSDPRAILNAYGMRDKEKPSLTGNWPAGSPFEMFEEE